MEFSGKDTKELNTVEKLDKLLSELDVVKRNRHNDEIDDLEKMASPLLYLDIIPAEYPKKSSDSK